LSESKNHADYGIQSLESQNHIREEEDNDFELDSNHTIDEDDEDDNSAMEREINNRISKPLINIKDDRSGTSIFIKKYGKDEDPLE